MENGHDADRELFVQAVRESGVGRERAHSLPLTAAFRARDAGVSPPTLRRLVAAGAVERLQHGVYRRVDAPPADDDLVVVAVREPSATICLLSALAQHALVTEIPTRWDLAVPRTRTPVVGNHTTRWHRFDAATFEVERATTRIGAGVQIGVYSSARSVVDAFRFPRLVARELAVEGLRAWLELRGSTPAHLMRVAAQLPGSDAALGAALRVLL